MNSDRKDEIQELYDRTNKISNLGNILFLLNIIISFILIFDFEYKSIIIIISIILTPSWTRTNDLLVL